MVGLYFDEFEIGQKFVHDIRRTVTETDNLLFTTLTHNPQPLHLDIEFCKKKSELGENLGRGGAKFPKPVRIGDTLRSETVVLEKRESKSRPNDGIVVFEHRSFNQKGEEVASCKRSALMK